MNMVALSNRLASKVPHWHELEKLSKEDKIEVTTDEITFLKKTHNILVPEQKKALIKSLEARMLEHAKNLEFEEAALLRDEIARIKEGAEV